MFCHSETTSAYFSGRVPISFGIVVMLTCVMFSPRCARTLRAGYSEGFIMFVTLNKSHSSVHRDLCAVLRPRASTKVFGACRARS